MMKLVYCQCLAGSRLMTHRIMWQKYNESVLCGYYVDHLIDKLRNSPVCLR